MDRWNKYVLSAILIFTHRSFPTYITKQQFALHIFTRGGWGHNRGSPRCFREQANMLKKKGGNKEQNLSFYFREQRTPKLKKYFKGWGTRENKENNFVGNKARENGHPPGGPHMHNRTTFGP